MTIYSENPKYAAIRIAGAAAGALVLMLIVLAIVRPDMMSMAMVHTLVSTIGL